MMEARVQARKELAWKHFDEGLNAYNNKHYEWALLKFTQAIQMDIGKPSFFYNRGITFFVLGNFPAAIDDLDAALRFTMGDSKLVSTIHSMRARAKIAQNDKLGITRYTKEVILDLKMAVRADPKSIKAQTEYGACLHDTGKPEQTINRLAIVDDLQAAATTTSYTDSTVVGSVVALVAAGIMLFRCCKRQQRPTTMRPQVQPAVARRG